MLASMPDVNAMKLGKLNVGTPHWTSESTSHKHNPYSHAGTVVSEWFMDDSASQLLSENSTTLSQKNPERMVTKMVAGDDVADL